jgi:hypothetical protein
MISIAIMLFFRINLLFPWLSMPAAFIHALTGARRQVFFFPALVHDDPDNGTVAFAYRSVFHG